MAQLEKEKKELNERLRIISKRIDHIERAYRKEERPLLALDYENQQKTDKETFEAIQKARLESAKQAHQEDLSTKARLSRMLPDYQARREALISKKGEEYSKMLEAAKKKIADEKEKKRKAVIKQREEERAKKEKEEQARRLQEAEEARLEEGMTSVFYQRCSSCSLFPPRTAHQRRKGSCREGSRRGRGSRGQTQSRRGGSCSPGSPREGASGSTRESQAAATARRRGRGPSCCAKERTSRSSRREASCGRRSEGRTCCMAQVLDACQLRPTHPYKEQWWALRTTTSL